jgi:cytoskeletal protein CcmA (bactofilin family)
MRNARPDPSAGVPGCSPWTQLGPGCLIRGDVVLTGDVTIYGRLEGTLFTDGTVTVAVTGTVEGGVHGRRVIVEGRCRGRVEALEGVVLRRGSVVQGEIAGEAVDVDPGALFVGERPGTGLPVIERYRPPIPHRI